MRTRGEGNWGLTWDYVWDVAAGLPVILNEKDRHYTLNGEPVRARSSSPTRL